MIENVKIYNIFKICDIIFKNNKVSSRHTYKNIFKNIFCKTSMPYNFTKYKIQVNLPKLYNYIKNKNNSSYCFVMKQLFAYLELPNPFIKIFKKMFAENKNEIIYKSLNEIEKIEMEKITAEYMVAKLNNCKNLDAKLYILFFLNIPPIRHIELANVKILKYNSSKKINFINIKNKTLNICLQKSSKSGNKKIKLEKHLIDFILKYISIKKEKYIFKNYTSSRFCKLATRYLDIKKFNHLIRNKYVMSNFNNWDAEEKKRNAIILGHGLDVQALIYNKN